MCRRFQKKIISFTFRLLTQNVTIKNLSVVFDASICCVNCDHFVVETGSGSVRGVEERTFLSNKTYISFKGIPYAKPPVGHLRFRSPVPIKSWRETLHAKKYGNSCLVIAQSQLFPVNSTQSEDCLFLNIFTPGLKSAKKPVMFFIHGGAFTEGDGTNAFYGPDFLVDNDVVLVTVNYRLGPWGFANFDEPGYTGNMGFKDQQLALEWTQKNIEFFGGDPNLITVFGESSGGVAVHLHALSKRSSKCMKRAIAMSGTAFTYFAHYEENNHIELIKEMFGLDRNSTGRDVLKFMINASADLIIQKTPAVNLPLNVIELFWGAVVEDKLKAENAFLIEYPRDIYKTRKIYVDVLFGFTSAENLVLLNPFDPYSWVEPMKSFSTIGMPFKGLTLSPESSMYIKMQQLVGKFYFGTEEIEPTIENLNRFVQLNTDTNFIYPIYEAMRMHSDGAKTFCYENDVQLNLNVLKMKNGLQELDGTAHFEDIFYVFYSKEYYFSYNQVMANQDDVTNQKTLNALHYVPTVYTNFAKTGCLGEFKEFQSQSPNCVQINNDGLKAIFGPRKEAIELWDNIYNQLKPWIVNQF